jgi:hypothetical protein
MTMRRILCWLGIAFVIVLVAIQLVPYGHVRTNPPGRVEPRWDRPETRALAVRACYDCHSNETVWPWYSNVAPMSWLTQRDVDEGRRAVNFSEWDQPKKDAHESAKTVRTGEMPPWFYVVIHPDARLTAAETTAHIGGLEATLGAKGGKRED